MQGIPGNSNTTQYDRQQSVAEEKTDRNLGSVVKSTNVECAILSLRDNEQGNVQQPPITSRTGTPLGSTKEEKINKCVKELQIAFPLPAEDSKGSVKAEKKVTHYWYSNDFQKNQQPGDRNMIEAIEKKPEIQLERPRIAMLVGESSLLACLPELAKRCNMVLMTDYDAALLRAQLKRLELIADCQSIADEDSFIAAVHS